MEEIKQFITKHLTEYNFEQLYDMLYNIYLIDRTILTTLTKLELELNKGDCILVPIGLQNILKESHKYAYMDYAKKIYMQQKLKELKKNDMVL